MFLILSPHISSEYPFWINSGKNYRLSRSLSIPDFLNMEKKLNFVLGMRLNSLFIYCNTSSKCCIRCVKLRRLKRRCSKYPIILQYDILYCQSKGPHPFDIYFYKHAFRSSSLISIFFSIFLVLSDWKQVNEKNVFGLFFLMHFSSY